MTTVYTLLRQATNEYGYNPYTHFKAANGDVIGYHEIDSSKKAEQMGRTLTFNILKHVREQGIDNFFKYVQPFVCDDMYIVALMIEIYRRTNKTSNVGRFYFGNDSTYIDFTSWDDLADALNILKPLPDFEYLNTYRGIVQGHTAAYRDLSNEHLLGAWFQRVYDEMAHHPTTVANVDVEKVRQESVLVDGMLSAALRVIGL